MATETAPMIASAQSEAVSLLSRSERGRRFCFGIGPFCHSRKPENNRKLDKDPAHSQTAQIQAKDPRMYDVRAVRYCKHCGEDLLRRERPYCKFCNSPFERQILISTSVLAPTPIVNRSYSVANGQELVWFVYGKSHDGEEISLEHPLRDEAERKWRSIWTSRYLLQFGSCRTHNEESLQYDEAIVKRWLDEVRDTAVMKSGDDLEPVVP